MLSPRRNYHFGKENGALFAYGNTCPRNILELFNLDAYNQGDVVKMLFLGCGDLRNMLFTLTHLRAHTSTNKNHTMSFEVHTNDINPVITARNILILKVISGSYYEEEDLDYIIDLWYNFSWSQEASRLRFIQDVTDLLKLGLPEKMLVTSAEQMKLLNSIWNEWLFLASEQYCNEDFIQQKSKKRYSHFRETLPSHQLLTDGMLEAILESWSSMWVSQDSPLAGKVKKEVAHFSSTGNLLWNGDGAAICINPTLLDPATNECHVHFTCFPYFLMPKLLHQEEHVDPAVRMRTTLSAMISSVQSLSESVRFHFDTGDALEYCLTVDPAATRFDVIDCSNLTDLVGLANTILCGLRILSVRPTSLLLTQSLSWLDLRPTLVGYVEEALGVPISMIPTMYGLQLVNRFELGSTDFSSLSCPVLPPTDFIWRRAPVMDVPLDATAPEFRACLQRLQRRCFVPHEPTHWTSEREGFGTKTYTPLTFHFFMTSLQRRLRLTSVPNVQVDPVFHTTLKVWDDWFQGKLVSAKKWSFPYTTYQKSLSDEYGFFRLVLLPGKTIPESNHLDSILNAAPGLHFVDNFQLRLTASEDRVDITFLLPADLELDPFWHSICLVYISRIDPIVTLTPLSSLKTSGEVLTLKHPFSKPAKLLSWPDTGELIVADSCVETETHFTVKCHFLCDNGGDLVVGTDRCCMSESCHRITLSFSHFGKTLMTLPHPVSSYAVHHTISRREKTIAVHLVKAVGEPWPVEFSAVQPKWDVSRLRLWSQDRRVLLQLPTDPDNPMNNVRKLVADIYEESICENGENIFIVKDVQGDVLWMIWTYLPILMSEHGCPILTLSAFDFELADRLLETFDPHALSAEYECVFGALPTHGRTIRLDSRQAADIFRHILRLNSTRMSWKKRQFAAIHKQTSVILTSHLSPLYDKNILDGRIHIKVLC